MVVRRESESTLIPFAITSVNMKNVIKDALKNVGETKKFKERLDETHSLYKQFAPLWKMTGDVALDRVTTNADKEQYLIQGTCEDDALFQERVEIAKFLPETPGLVAEFLGTIYQQPVQRTLPDTKGDVLTEFMDAADTEENPMSEVAERAAEMALVFGSVDAFLDHPAIASKKPFIALLTPEQRLDWQEDENDRFAWVKYKTVHREKLSWLGEVVDIEEYRIIQQPTVLLDGTKIKGTITKYRAFMVDRTQIIEVFDAKDGFWKFFDTSAPGTLEFTPIEYDFHRLPVQTLYWKKIAVGIGDPWVKPLVKSDIKTFLKESDFDWDVFVHAHPKALALLHSTDDDEEGKGALDRISLDTNDAIQLNPGDADKKPEDIRYLKLETADLTLQMESIATSRILTRRLAGKGPESDKTETWGHPESGKALEVRHDKKVKNFATLARRIETWEFMIGELVILEAEPNGDAKVKKMSIKYPHRFDLRSANELFDHLIFAEKIGSKTLVTEMSDLLGIRILGHGGTRELYEIIQKEIKARKGKLRMTIRGDDGLPVVIGGEDDQAEQLKPVSFNDLSLAMERASRIGDDQTVDVLRNELLARIGGPKVPDVDPNLMPANIRRDQVDALIEQGKERTAGGGGRNPVTSKEIPA